MKQWFGSLFFMIALVLNVALLLPFFIIFGIFNWKLRVFLMRKWCLLVLKELEFFCNINYKLEGFENISQKPALYISNHSSTLETFLFAALLPTHSVILKRSLLWIPVWGWSMAIMKPIAIDRKQGKEAFKSMLKFSKLRVAEGQSILIFPEGTRVREGERIEFKKGAFLLANSLKIPIIPISHNSGLAWAKHSFLKKPGTVSFRMGPEIAVEGKSLNELMQESRAWIDANYVSNLEKYEPIVK